jgi:hypothetical protein
MEGVDICWLHLTDKGEPDVHASRLAAIKITEAFHVAYIATLHGSHEDGLAVDMRVSWHGDMTIKGGGDGP